MNTVPTCECGVIMSSRSGRCPSCGVLWGETPEVAPERARARRPAEPRRSVGPASSRQEPIARLAGSAPAASTTARGAKVPIILGLLAGLAAGGLALALLTRRGDAPEEPVAAAPPATAEAGSAAPGAATGPLAEASAPALAASSLHPDPGALGLRSLSNFSPFDVLAPATTRARAWNPDAALVEMRITGAIHGRLDASKGSSIEVAYGKSRAGVAGGAVGRERLFVVVDSDGSRVREGQSDGAAASAAEPGCPLTAAWGAIVASGVRKDAVGTLRYFYFREESRAVWEFQVPGEPALTRRLDGESCVILTR